MRSVSDQEAQFPRLGGRGRNLGKADGLEDLAQIGRGVDVGGVHVGADPAPHQLLAAAPAGDQADAHFHQAHVQLGVGHDAVGRQADLGAAAQRHLMRRSHDRLGRGAHGHEDVLAFLDGHAQFFPQAALDGDAHGEQVGAHAEVAPIVGDDQAIGAAVKTVDGLLQNLELGRVQLVDLAVELQQHDAVADVEEAGHFIARQCLASCGAHRSGS